MQSSMLHRRACAGTVRSRQSVVVRAQDAVVQAPAKAVVRVVPKDHGSYSVRGTVRKVNEDRCCCQVAGSGGNPGDAIAFGGVFDGHGGTAVAEWLESKLVKVVSDAWKSKSPESSMTEAFLAADTQLLTVKKGFMGMGERGVGGSKCGATAAVALVYVDPQDSSRTNLVTSNIGDARVVLIRNGEPIQLTVDHVPDDEDERKRIERFNPNPKMPLVRYVGGTWRVGGLLALSRAFGDAYLKGSLQFEGLTEGSDGYSSGFGLIAEPHTVVTPLTGDDEWLVISSDGLFSEVERGGGGGLDNATLAKMLATAAAKGTPCAKIAEQLASSAVELGSTDDVTVVVMKLGEVA